MSTTTQQYTRVAIVTGAAQGIGKGVSLRLAADGLDIVVADLPGKIDELNKVVKEIEGLGRKAVAVPTNVTKEEEVKALVEAAVSNLGRVDVMVANAGVAGIGVATGPVIDANVDNWDKCWDVNIRGVLFSYKHAALQMIKQGNGGRLIGASSLAGTRGYANMGAYCVSKFAVRALTQTTAQELREHKITANAYAPGAIDTEMIADPADKEHGVGFGIKQFMKVPLWIGTGQPSDVANVVSFLASPDSHFVTGQTISVDDGIHLS
ncbi:hypothetical protein R3P38DRAFT_2953136 [Favolaschia claudopus]|uniref:NAD(P)-binding protein n=1 Tax=Favolaschia claudopus TaxID=2862362 RepID=A0AAW0BG93_9AGAR